jgi:uncharacterized lipoprotein YmbA
MCGSKVRYPNYYVLNIPAPASEPVQMKPTLGSAAVRQFYAPTHQRTGPVVYRQSPVQLGFYKYDCWAVGPREALTTAFVQTLQARKVFQSVGVFSGRASSDFLIIGTLAHLGEVDRGHEVFISVDVSAQLLDLRPGDVP